jgi:hypothetical protein
MYTPTDISENPFEQTPIEHVEATTTTAPATLAQEPEKAIAPAKPMTPKSAQTTARKQPKKPSVNGDSHWPASVRRCPNVISRSALFGVVAKGGHRSLSRKDRFLLEVPIKAPEGTTIIYSGYRLDQKDFDLWLEILFLASHSKDKSKVVFSGRAMLRNLGYIGIGGSSFKRLHKRLERLNDARLKIHQGKNIDLTGLIGTCKINSETELMEVNLNEDVAKLFLPNSWTQYEYAERKTLKFQLSQWLHAFYSTHENSHHQYSSSLLKELCGSEAKLLRFEQTLEEAFEELRKIGWKIWLTETENKLGQKVSKVSVFKPEKKPVAVATPDPAPALKPAPPSDHGINPLMNQKTIAEPLDDLDKEIEVAIRKKQFTLVGDLRARRQRARVAL